jgi:hypothetical protein
VEIILEVFPLTRTLFTPVKWLRLFLLLFFTLLGFLFLLGLGTFISSLGFHLSLIVLFKLRLLLALLTPVLVYISLSCPEAFGVVKPLESIVCDLGFDRLFLEVLEGCVVFDSGESWVDFLLSLFRLVALLLVVSGPLFLEEEFLFSKFVLGWHF